MKVRIVMSVVLIAVLSALVYVTTDSHGQHDIPTFAPSTEDRAFKSLSIN